ncbi:MAG: hypothetical protein IBX64_04345 [Actinobacteria bacterium]|nr:hypothetical protein [Actinomycetota bacterium]
MEKAGYVILAIVAAAWFVALLMGLIAAFPFGIFGLLVIVGFGLLFAKALRDRLESVKTDRYSKEVEK